MSKKSSKKTKSSSVPPAPKPKQTAETPAVPPAASPVSRVGTSSTRSLKERKDERDKLQRRNQQVTIAGVIGVVALVVALLFLSANQPAEAPVDVANNYANIPVGADLTTGFPRLGNPEAPVTLVEYSSFGCPGCKEFHDTVFPLLLDRIRAGEVAFVFFPQFTGAGNVKGAAQSALCVAQQDQEKFWELHDIFFNWQGLYGTNAFNQNRITTGMNALGINMNAFGSCLNSQRISDLILVAERDSQSTPTIKINNNLQPDISAAALLAVIDSSVSAARVANPDLVLPIYSPEATAEPEAAATTEALATEETAATNEAVATEEVQATESVVVTEEAAVTSEPTAEPTNVPTRRPSATPRQPTATVEPTSTNVPTRRPSATPRQPTATVEPTSTNVPTRQPSATPRQPTATKTDTKTPTRTPGA